MRSVIAAILSLFVVEASAQRLLTVEDAIAQALKTNYDILLMKNDAQGYETDARYADAAFLPAVNATAGRVWNSNAQKQNFTDGRKRQADVSSGTTSAVVSLDWTLFDGLKMFATRSRLEEMRNLGELNLKAQVVDAIAAVITNYYNIVRAEQQIRAIDTLIAINDERVKLADKKIFVGLGSKPELLQAKVDLNAQWAERLNQEKTIAQLKEQLNQLIGVSVTQEYVVADSIPINLDISLDSIVNNIEKTSPALLSSFKTIDIASLALKERKAERWPLLQFNSAYNFSRTSNGSVVNPEFQPIFSMNNGFNYGFSARIPILNGFNTRRLIKQAQLDVSYNTIAYDAQRSRVHLGVHNTYKEYEYAKKALVLEEDNISLAKENVSIALERFRKGVSTFLELREAQKSLEEAYSRLITARYNTKVAETELLRLKGTLNF